MDIKSSIEIWIDIIRKSETRLNLLSEYKVENRTVKELLSAADLLIDEIDQFKKEKEEAVRSRELVIAKLSTRVSLFEETNNKLCDALYQLRNK